ncbi:MAG TPA: 30S ribosomal protein S9 [Nitriliruptorales bacterium]
MSEHEKIFIGRRKTARARTRLRPGSGQFILNGRSLEEYFRVEKHRYHVLQPLELVEQANRWDIIANIDGGGITGQAGALRLAIARALADNDPELRQPLKDAGMLRRDARKVERKKYGLKKARKAPQFSKR